jgi:hypothetical protein
MMEGGTLMGHSPEFMKANERLPSMADFILTNDNILESMISMRKI